MAENDNFVFLTKVRSGLKREFEFALRTQNQLQLSGSRTRTRARKGRGSDQKRTRTRSMKLEMSDSENDDDDDDEAVSDVLDDDVTSDDDGGGGGGQRGGLLESQRRENEVRKMSGVPTRVKELLDTGLLEGLSVKYIRGVKKPLSGVGLVGVIRGDGILCYCGDCKGAKVVKPNQFELHAGSLNKRVADYTYLENGSTLRDVLSACRKANFDSLRNVILCAIGSSPVKHSASCSNCKCFISEPAVEEETPLLCDSCLRLKASQTTPTQTIDAGESVLNHPRFTLVQQKSSFSSAFKTSSLEISEGRITRKDLRLHKLVFQDDFLPDGTALGYYARGKKILSGYKKGFGIFCYCCQNEVSPSQFEAHAGCASRRKPYLNIYTSNGASLHELCLNLSKSRQFSTDENDDLCSICHDAGDLLCCDGCPRAFHLECIRLPSIPEDKWFCKYCEDMFQKEKFAEHNPNAIAAGRIPGVDPMEQITNRCIRIIKDLGTQDGIFCALCSAKDFCKIGFGPRTVIICDQCEREYHVGCLREHKKQFLKELPGGDWLCSSDCERIHSTLKGLVENGEQKLPGHLLDVIKRKQVEKGLNGDDFDISWRVFNRRMSCSDDKIRSLLATAVSVFHEQFDPIQYGTVKQDLIPHMVFGRDTKDREFGGMFCAVLSVNSTIVTAGVFRIFGNEAAEVPLVATSKDCEGKGYFQCLYACIERLLEDLDVKTILLPAAEEVTSLWTSRFGFDVMPEQELDNLRSRHALMIFEGTSMLYRPVLKSTT